VLVFRAEGIVRRLLAVPPRKYITCSLLRQSLRLQQAPQIHDERSQMDHWVEEVGWRWPHWRPSAPTPGSLLAPIKPQDRGAWTKQDSPFNQCAAQGSVTQGDARPVIRFSTRARQCNTDRGRTGFASPSQTTCGRNLPGLLTDRCGPRTEGTGSKKGVCSSS